MEKRDVLQDEFLANLVRGSSDEKPSAEFLSNVMSRVETIPAYDPKKKPFFLYLKMFLPWVLLAAVIVVVLLTSDFPFASYIPGYEYFQNELMPFLTAQFTSLIQLFSNKFISISVAVICSGIILFGLDRILTRRVSFRHQYLV